MRGNHECRIMTLICVADAEIAAAVQNVVRALCHRMPVFAYREGQFQFGVARKIKGGFFRIDGRGYFPPIARKGIVCAFTAYRDVVAPQTDRCIGNIGRVHAGQGAKHGQGGGVASVIEGEMVSVSR